MYLLAQVYSVLAFAETMVLFASVLGLLVLGLRLTVRGLNILIDAAIDSSARDADSGARKPSRLNVAAGGGYHKIPGGHNERF